MSEKSGRQNSDGSYWSAWQKLSFLTSAFIIACSYIGVVTYLFQIDTWLLGGSSFYGKVVRNLRTNPTVRQVCDYVAKNYFFEIIGASVSAAGGG